MASREAQISLAKKIRLERRLEIAMRKILFDYADDVEKIIEETGELPNARAQTGEQTLEALEKQYRRVSEEFKTDFREQELSKNTLLFLETKNVDNDIEAALATFINVTTIEHTGLIVGTTQTETESAIIRATIELLEQERELADDAVAKLTAEKLRRGVPGRASNIATTETQVAAEGTKDVEANTILRTPEVPEVEDVVKEWEDMDDSKVRDTHREADGQQVSARDAFSVGGFAMRFPGDGELGAPIKEIARCRCNTRYVNRGPLE